MRNKVTKQEIDSLIKNANIDVTTVKGKCTVVVCQLKNGFILTESSGCVDPANYDEKIGYEACMERITQELWKLEGYKLQCEMSDSNGA
jgi:hypothetical protein